MNANDRSSAEKTAKAARRLRRRTFLAAGAATMAVLAGGVRIVGGQSERGLSILNWADELPDPVIPNFEKATGIKVRSTPFSQSQEQIGKLQATGGVGFDLCQPARDQAPQFKDLGLLAAFDLNRLANSDNLLPSMIHGSTSVWAWDDGLHHLPHCWGTEAISWRTDHTTLDYPSLSYGTLWEERYRGRVQGRPDSLLLGIGLWMDGSGHLPSNRMLDAYKDEEAMKRLYDVILRFAVEHKRWIRQFWDGAAAAKAGFAENGCVIGKTWDGPALSLKKNGMPIGYMAPQEGAITWLDGWAITRAARNIEEAYEFLNYLMTPEVGAQIAEGSGYNPVVAGAQLSDQARKGFAETYPEDALRRLWHRPPEPSWFAALRLQYAEKFASALKDA